MLQHIKFEMKKWKYMKVIIYEFEQVYVEIITT